MRSDTANPPYLLYVCLVYFVLGAIIAGDNMLFSVGLLYLSASTYSLICATRRHEVKICYWVCYNSRSIHSLISHTVPHATFILEGSEEGNIFYGLGNANLHISCCHLYLYHWSFC